MYKIIPLTNEPNQSLTITLPIDDGNRTFDIECRYNEVAKYWTLKISDNETSEVLIDNLPLLTAKYPSANILEQYSYKRIGSIVLIKKGDIDLDVPNDVSLGNEFLVLWGDTIG